MNEKNKLDYMKDLLVSLFGGYLITFVGILLIAFLLLMFQISENVVNIGIIIIYVLACLGGGIIIGKRTKNRKFLWGMICGGAYFLLLILISLVIHRTVGNIGSDLVTVLLICIGSGTLGGMLS